jgi:hypothetical protein
MLPVNPTNVQCREWCAVHARSVFREVRCLINLLRTKRGTDKRVVLRARLVERERAKCGERV